MHTKQMSRLKNKTLTITEPTHQESEPTDYVPQHPMTSFRHKAVQDEPDHLSQYTEVHPFEDSEISLKKFGAKLKTSAKAAGKAAKAAAGKAASAAGKLKEKFKYKKDVKKIEKIVGKIEKEEKKLRKLRKKHKNVDAFDAAVKAKLDKAEEEIYTEALN